MIILLAKNGIWDYVEIFSIRSTKFFLWTSILSCNAGIGVKLCGHHPEATYRSNIPPLWGATSASFEMSSYLHGCQPTMCKVTGHRPSRKVMSLNHITVIPGIGKPKYVHTYLQKNMPLAFRLALWFNFLGFADSF